MHHSKIGVREHLSILKPRDQEIVRHGCFPAHGSSVDDDETNLVGSTFSFPFIYFRIDHRGVNNGQIEPRVNQCV